VEDPAFENLLIVVAAGFAAPFALGLSPRLRLPAVVLEITLGILIGPVLGWADVDEPVRVLSLIGLAFLLFLAGLEIDIDALRGKLLRSASIGFAVSLFLAVAAGLLLNVAGIADEPLLIAVILASTSLGIVVPVLDDAGETQTKFGQLVIAASSIADFASVLLLSLFFSGQATGTGTKLLLVGVFVLALAAVAATISRAEMLGPVSRTLRALQDTSAQIRVRGAFVLLIGMVALAEALGLELILGAFAAGAIVNRLDNDEQGTHPEFRHKLTAVGFGVFIPVFFVSSGVSFDLDALVKSPTAVMAIPAFLVALVVARRVPAIFYRGQLGSRRAVAAGLLQATSLTFIVAATAIGRDLGLIDASTSAAFISAGLLSVVAFPLAALALMRTTEAARA